MSFHNHYVATSYVYDSVADRFLLIWHRKAGKWLSPGGHVYAGEEPHRGALRELLEETGVEGRIVNLLATPEVATPTTPQLPAPFCILAERIPAEVEGEEHLHIDFVYVVEIPSAAVGCADGAGRADGASLREAAKWVAAEELDYIDTYENVRQVCRAIRTLAQKA